MFETGVGQDLFFVGWGVVCVRKSRVDPSGVCCFRRDMLLTYLNEREALGTRRPEGDSAHRKLDPSASW